MTNPDINFAPLVQRPGETTTEFMARQIARNSSFASDAWVAQLAGAGVEPVSDMSPATAEGYQQALASGLPDEEGWE